MVILALSLLTPYFYFIPKATLSSVIICAVIFMVELGMVKPMWKSNSEYHSNRPIDRHSILNVAETSFIRSNGSSDRLCGLVVRVPGCRSRGPGFDSRRYYNF
jgi:hypothetical protein